MNEASTQPHRKAMPCQDPKIGAQISEVITLCSHAATSLPGIALYRMRCVNPSRQHARCGCVLGSFILFLRDEEEIGCVVKTVLVQLTVVLL